MILQKSFHFYKQIEHDGVKERKRVNETHLTELSFLGSNK